MLVVIDKLYRSNDNCLCSPNVCYTCCKYNNIKPNIVCKKMFINSICANQQRPMYFSESTLPEFGLLSILIISCQECVWVSVVNIKFLP